MTNCQYAATAVTVNCSLSTSLAIAKGNQIPVMNQPSYAAAFRCIGPVCEDPCCGEWDIPLDKRTYEKYQGFSNENLGATVSRFVILNEPHQPEELYGLIKRTSSGVCPFYAADRLCDIQRQYGPELLSASCSIYPRSLSVVNGQLEGALSLSCPEAVRSVLLVPDIEDRVFSLHSGEFRTDNVYQLANDQGGQDTKPEPLFLPVRKMLIDIIRDRSRPLWDRLLRVGYLCLELESLNPKRTELLLQSNLLTLRALTNSGLLQEEIDHLERNPKVRLGTIFGLTEVLMRDGSSVRLQDTFLSFVNGIRRSIDSPATSDIKAFLRAERKYHSPFFDRFPFILENYLINYIYQTLFPYGRSGSYCFSLKSIFGEYLQMATQFAWVNGLLIGVAGDHQGAFAEEHVVKAVQSFTRAFEHDPSGLHAMNEYIHRSGLDNLQGMSILLRP